MARHNQCKYGSGRRGECFTLSYMWRLYHCLGFLSQQGLMSYPKKTFKHSHLLASTRQWPFHVHAVASLPYLLSLPRARTIQSRYAPGQNPNP
uniref:Uncharacterized protein n=1 Tax=Arundo donax TaxID=35708 RepID=A0A0A9C0H6_ARUDO